MNRRGFTITELILVITILGILLVLGVVNLRGSQAQARDDERKADIEAIGLSLESFYSTGTTGSTTLGRYPSTALIGDEQTYLRDIDPKLLKAPGSANPSVIAATNATQTAAGVAPQPTTGQYLYQPLKLVGSTWSVCTDETQECRKFNLYYRLEADDTVYMVTSKNQ